MLSYIYIIINLLCYSVVKKTASMTVVLLIETDVNSFFYLLILVKLSHMYTQVRMVKQMVLLLPSSITYKCCSYSNESSILTSSSFISRTFLVLCIYALSLSSFFFVLFFSMSSFCMIYSLTTSILRNLEWRILNSYLI